MIDKLYKDYFQKSWAFIYPLVNINKKAEFTPACTYFGWKSMYAPSDSRLIVTYTVDVASTFLNPSKFFKLYSELLDADEELLNSVGELCNCPDVTKECLVLETQGY